MALPYGSNISTIHDVQCMWARGTSEHFVAITDGFKKLLWCYRENERGGPLEIKRARRHPFSCMECLHFCRSTFCLIEDLRRIAELRLPPQEPWQEGGTKQRHTSRATKAEKPGASANLAITTPGC